MTSHFRIDATASVLAIVAGIIHLGAYWGIWWSVPETGTQLYWRVGGTVVLCVVLTIIISILVAVSNRDAPETDEREEIIGLKAVHLAFYAYSGGVTYVFLDAFGGNSPMDIAHMMIGVLVLAEIVRLGALAYHLRRGI